MEFRDQVKSSVDIVNVIGEYVRLRKTGTRYAGLCPFHNEKTPSFSVNPQHQFFKCFGCGEAGDVIGFVMKREGLGFFEALKLLAERNGIPVPKRSGHEDEDAKARAAIYRIHEIAEAEFRRLLTSDAGTEARRYLQGRGVSTDSMERFSLGYAPRNSALLRLLGKEGFAPIEIENSGLALKREDGTFYERFRNRLIFPIHNESGKPIAFGGRALTSEDQPKYLNSPETRIYKKSTVLYNLHRAKEAIRSSDRIVLVEGYMDAIGAFTAGVQCVVASCGTALTSQQVQSLRRQSAKVVVNFDADSAGANAAERSIQMLLAEGLQVRILTLDNGMDPDEYCREFGADQYLQQIERAKGYFHWLADRARSRHDMRSAEGRYAAFQMLLPAIQNLQDKLERAAVVNDVAAYLGIDKGIVLESFRKMGSEAKQTLVSPQREPMRPADRILISVLLSQTPMRDDFFVYLRGLPSLKNGAAGKIYEALLAMNEAGAPLTYDSLHARLPEAEQNILADALLSGETNCDDPSETNAMACLEALVEDERELERTTLKTRIREAERAGNLQEALRLWEQLTRAQVKA